MVPREGGEGSEQIEVIHDTSKQILADEGQTGAELDHLTDAAMAVLTARSRTAHTDSYS